MPGEWMAFHVFYASDANPILVECVRPLVARLRADGLLDRWFFIKYWEEGPHLRIRLRPSDAAAADEVRARALAALTGFLERRPALYEVAVDDLQDLYRRMYLAEYGPEQWDEVYGAEGVMPIQPNNTVVERPYEPEHDRYGGPGGTELAERHFEVSSDTVVGLLATTSTHVRPLQLGLSMQLSLGLAYAFLTDDAAVLEFFRSYRTFWETTYQEPSDDQHESFDVSFERTWETFAPRLARIRAVCADPDAAAPGLEGAWARHARALRAQVDAAWADGTLAFPADRAAALAAHPEAVAPVLLSSYVHMTNNRLGSSILEEIYLSYLVERALEPARSATP